MIALEPECAALYVWHQRGEHHAPESRAENYAVVDCGGGTIDIAYHSVMQTPGEKTMVVKELAPPSGGPFGGTLVDGEFQLVLTNVLRQNNPRLYIAHSTRSTRFKLQRVKTILDSLHLSNH